LRAEGVTRLFVIGVRRITPSAPIRPTGCGIHVAYIMARPKSKQQAPMTTASVASWNQLWTTQPAIWRTTDTGLVSTADLLGGIKPLLQSPCSYTGNMVTYSLLTDPPPEGSQFFKWRAMLCAIDFRSASADCM